MTINPKLLEPTLLWSNPNPNNSFSAQNVLFEINTSIFKYIVIEWKSYLGATIGTSDGNKIRGSYISKYENIVGVGYMLAESENNYRIFSIKSNTTLIFDDAQSSFEAPNQLLIPTKIYGTNIL